MCDMIGRQGGEARSGVGGEERAMEPRQSWTKWAFASPVIRMQVSITLILTTMVTVMAVLIWRETTESQYRQVETYSQMVRDNLLQRTNDSMFAILQSTRNRNELISRSFGLEIFPAVNDMDKDFYERAKRLLWPSFKMHPQMGSSYFVRDVDGVSVGFTLFMNQTLFFHTANPGNITIKATVLDNNNGEELNVGPLFYDFMDPRDYFGAEFLTEPHLKTRVRLGNSDNFVVLEVSTRATLQTPLLNPQGDVFATRGIKGTVESAYPLEELSKLMSDLDLLGGVMFVTSGSGIIVAASDDTIPFQMNTVTKDKELIRAAQVNNSLVAGTAQWLETKYGNMSNLIKSPPKDSNVKIGHRKYFIDTAAVPFPSFEMVIVVVIPRECIMGEVDKSARKIAVFLISLSVTCLSIGLGLLLLLTKHMANGLRLRKELSHQLEAKQRAEACTASARLFLANLSHDLRTPMAAIIGLLDIMSGNGLEAEQMNLLEQVQGNADTLHTLLNSVLDINTVEAGTLQLCSAPFDILKELESIVDLFSIEGMNKGVDVLLDLPDEMPRVRGDAFRFRQIFANLLSNCVRFTQTGHVIVRGFILDQDGIMNTDATRFASARGWRYAQQYSSISKKRTPPTSSVVVDDSDSDGKVLFVNPLAALPQSTMRRSSSSLSKFSSSWTLFNNKKKNGRQAKWGRLNSAKSSASTADDMATLMFEIEDTGSGIDAEHREAMFQNFVSLPNSSTRYGGTGVGLGIVRSLIELMGGQIEIVDKSSPGALFRFTVALKVQHQVDVESDESDDSLGNSLAEETRLIWAQGTSVTTPNSTLHMMHPSPAHHHKKYYYKYTTATTHDVATATEIQWTQKVVLGMPDGHMQAEVAARWFKHHGCHVSKVSSWKCMQLALDSFWHHFHKTRTEFKRPQPSPTSPHKATEIESAQQCDQDKFRCLFLLDSALIPNEEGTGPALQQLEFLGRDMRRRLRMVDASVVSTGRHGDDGYGDGDDDDVDGDAFMMPCLAMVLLTTAATPPALQRAAKSAGFQILQKPLVPSRLMPFLKFLRGMGNGNLPSDTRVPRLSSQNVNKVMGLLPTAEKPVGKLQSNSPRHKTSSSKEETWQEDRSKVEGRGSSSSSSSSLRRPEMASSTTAVTCSNVNDGICSSTKEEGVTENTPKNLASPTAVTSIFSVGLEALRVEAAEAEGAPKESLRVLAEGLHHNNLVPLPTSPHRLRPQGDEEAPSPSASASASASAHTPGVASATSNDNKRLAPTPGLAGGPKVGGLRVLLVEDTAVMAQIARKQLEKMGASVWWAKDGQIAVEMFASSCGIAIPTTTTTTTTTTSTESSCTRQNMMPSQQPSSASPMGQPFDIIVMDCQMPRLDGYGATAAIRHLEISLGIHRTPIIALTAHAMTTDRKKCLDAGMDEYLAKPLNVKLLQAMLEKLLGGPRDDSS